jgi:predicted DNA binding CopG/RHH family protein
MKQTSITFRLSEEEKEQLKTIATKRVIPVSQLVRELCKNIIKED